MRIAKGEITVSGDWRRCWPRILLAIKTGVGHEESKDAGLPGWTSLLVFEPPPVQRFPTASYAFHNPLICCIAAGCWYTFFSCWTRIRRASNLLPYVDATKDYVSADAKIKWVTFPFREKYPRKDKSHYYLPSLADQNFPTLPPLVVRYSVVTRWKE